jgi:hypothetical protein
MEPELDAVMVDSFHNDVFIEFQNYAKHPLFWFIGVRVTEDGQVTYRGTSYQHKAIAQIAWKKVRGE